jgi:hypothetical protein
MSLDTQLFTALAGLVGGRVYPDVAPELAPLPFVTYQSVGGEAVNFLDTATLPSQRNARVQINVWAATRAAASALAAAVEDTLRSSPTLRATVLGAASNTVDADLKLRGTLQDFSIWYA